MLSDSGFALTFGQIVSISVKELDNTNLVASSISKGKEPHFRLTCVAQKRVCLSSLIRGSFFSVVTTIMVRTNVQSSLGQIMAFFHDKSVPTL